MNYQKNRDTYRNGDCMHKRSSRFILQGLLQSMFSRGSGLVTLTMPALSFQLEQFLLNDYYGHQDWVEINSDIYKKQKRIVKYYQDRDGMKTARTINENVFDVKLDYPLHFVWLDLCSILTPIVLGGIANFAQNNTFNSAAGGHSALFAVTLRTCRELPSHQRFYRKLYKQYWNTPYKGLTHFRNNVMPLVLEKVLAEATESKIELVAQHTYSPSSSTGASYMTMFAFHLTK
jgi:hypothetical protein